MPGPDDLITITTRHQAHLERLKSGDVQRAREFLQRMDRSLREQLAGAEITEWRRARLEQQISAVGALLRGLYREYEGVWRRQINELAVYEADFESRALGRAAVAGVNFTLPAENQLIEAVYGSPLHVRGADGGMMLESFFRRNTDLEIERIEGAIRMAYAQGQTTNQLLQTIRGTRANNYRDGLMDKAGRSAEMMTRTALQHASSQARQEVWRVNQDLITGVQWVSTLDSRTCFVGGTPVETPDGTKPIQSLRKGDQVIGGTGKARRVLGTAKTRSNRLVRVRLSNGESAVCTDDHLWLTASGWVEARSLSEGIVLKNKV